MAPARWGLRPPSAFSAAGYPVLLWARNHDKIPAIRQTVDIDRVARLTFGLRMPVVVSLFEITAEQLTACRQLKVIAKHGVSVDNTDVAAATARGPTSP